MRDARRLNYRPSLGWYHFGDTIMSECVCVTRRIAAQNVQLRGFAKLNKIQKQIG